VGLLAAGLLVQPAAAERRTGANVHSFSDSQGNRVDSYVVDFGQGLRQDWALGVRGVLDRVHLPPLPGLPGSRENVDAITAASRPVRSEAQSKESYTKQRTEVTTDVRWQPHGGRTRGGGSYYVSRESDYLGQQVSLDLARDYRQANTNLALRTAFGFDRIEPDAHTGGDPRVRYRQSLDLVAVCTQTLSRRTLGQVGVEVTAVNGFQNNPYRQVYDGGVRQPENHPDERLRGAVFAQLDRWLMTRSSVSLAARWYRDDWDVQAGSLDARFNQYVGERLIVRYRYRFYAQTAAWFWRDLYEGGAGVDGYRTADYKLQEFTSNLFGIKVSVPFEGTVPWLDGLVLDCKYERYFDSKSFAANVLEAGFIWPF
jgi:hypothetical protein